MEDPTGLNYQTKYTYDALGNLKQVCQNFTSACGETRTYQYDSLSRLTSAANPESKNLSTTYAYDSNGNLVTKTDANGVITCYGNLSGSTCTSSSVGYDSLNRLLKKSYSDTGTSTVSYTYDSVSKGRLSSVANGVSTTSYTAYDSLGRVKASSQSTDGQTYAFSGYTYNRAGALTSVTYPSARVVNTSYDGADRVSLVSSGTTNYATLTTAPSQGIYAYTPHGAIQQMSLANGVVAVATPYSADRLQPQSVTATVGSTTPLSLGFYYCPNKGSSCTTNNGNLITQTMATLRQDYGYDKANRLTSAAESGGSSEWSQTYGFDAYGNRWVSANSGYTLSTFTPTTPSFYDTFNRLNLTVGSAYDNAGNQTQQGGYTQAYDAENRVKSSTIGGATTTYSYDGAGRRVMKVSGGVTTVYVYDVQGQLAAEYATAVANSPCRTCYLTGDHLGSTRLVTDGSGNTVSLHDYLPWGEEIPAGVGGRGTIYGAPDSVRHKFTGKERDAETGLDYFGARYFSGPQGRFTSPDKPFADQHPENPQTWNLYMYGRNNPVRFLDDTGQASIDYLRRVAVRMAWEQERALVQRTGQGTRDWSAAELEILKNGGTPSGYQGHHINSVKGSPELAGDPNNIQFATPEEHLQDLHGGDTRVPTFGDLISRSLGVLSIVQVFTSQLGAVRETQVTGVTESMSPFSFGNTYIVDPAKAAVTLNGAYIQVNGENGGLYQVQNGNYTRVGCTDKPDQCTVDPNKLKGSQFEIVDPRKMM